MADAFMPRAGDARGAPQPCMFDDAVTLVPDDPAIYCGVLPCGLRYALQPNSYPPNRIMANLAVNVGSVNEQEHERGVSLHGSTQHGLGAASAHAPAAHLRMLAR
jgi:hypothetical protein